MKRMSLWRGSPLRRAVNEEMQHKAISSIRQDSCLIELFDGVVVNDWLLS